MKKHIYIISPSGAVRDKAAFKRGLSRLKSLGHDVEVDEAALKSHMRFAGDDETRLAGIQRAAASGANVVLTTRGGYGLTRLLPQLPYKAIAKAVEKGTQFVGMSDFTALQCAVLAKTGSLTWAGPVLGGDFGTEEAPDDIMEACFDDFITGSAEGSGWRLGKDDFAPAAAKKNASADSPKVSSTPASFHVKKATLWGGNLAVLTSLLGTPYFPQIKGGVLFLEDVGESPYRIERMLTQLLHAGVLAQQKAVVLGQFTEYQLVPHDARFRLATVVAWLRSQLKVPVLTGLPFGHVPTKVMLPVGAQIELAVEGREALMFWGHMHSSMGGHQHAHHDHDHGHHHHGEHKH
ncbi:LD-carboxypeptidase [Variovorax sp. HJSM1_2]|uniref:LD-carboxypeptidase n=1 Tax=Variovorax sp. HJSM1_2 TaxID=3366263 RepID=UPI003BECC684